MSTIQWLSDLDQAFERARDENKLVFLDFYSPA